MSLLYETITINEQLLALKMPSWSINPHTICESIPSMHSKSFQDPRRLKPFAVLIRALRHSAEGFLLNSDASQQETGAPKRIPIPALGRFFAQYSTCRCPGLDLAVEHGFRCMNFLSEAQTTCLPWLRSIDRWQDFAQRTTSALDTMTLSSYLFN